ncbi:MAG: hypothetical protein RL609_966 [Bacteroidota bacterium]|jgi:hypothetical protein
MKKALLFLGVILSFLSNQGVAQNQPCGDSLHYVQINMTTGSWGSEMSWTFLNSSNIPINGGGPYGNNQAFTLTQCLPAGCYTMHLHDSFGDGWNGGTMQLILDGQIIFSGTLSAGSDLVFTVAIDAMGCQSSIPAGCMDPAAANFDPAAQMSDGSCVYLGCTDPYAMNYNASATQNDSSCVYCDNGVYAHLYICAFGNGDQINLNLLDSNGVSIFTSPILNSGAIYNTNICLDSAMCYTALMTNNAGLTGWNNGYFWITVGGVQVVNQSLDASLSSEEANFGMYGPCNVVVVEGCTDGSALNYNPQATFNDNSCIYPVYGCTDINALNYNPLATATYGCIYPNACGNLNMIYFESSAADLSYNDYYTITNEENVIVGYAYLGESNFACVEDGCYFLQYNTWALAPYTDTVLVTINNNQVYGYTSGQLMSSINTFCINDSTGFAVLGCTDNTAINFNSMATENDNSCVYASDCLNGFTYIQGTTGYWGNEMSFELTNSAGEVVYSFEGSSSNTTILDYVCLSPDCYTLNMEDSWGDGWNGGYVYIVESTGAGFCEGSLSWGSSGVNAYSVGGMCTEVLWGCMDSTAMNYASWATQDDGSCFYNDNDTTNWNPGMVVNTNWEIKVFPNPAQEEVWVNISGLKQDAMIRYEMFGMDGRLISKHSQAFTGNNNIEIKGLEDASGIFFVKVTVQNESQMVRLIKL